MKHLFNNLSESEKNRILEMHKSATSKQYLGEQESPSTDMQYQKDSVYTATRNVDGKTYKLKMIMVSQMDVRAMIKCIDCNETEGYYQGVKLDGSHGYDLDQTVKNQLTGNMALGTFSNIKPDPTNTF